MEFLMRDDVNLSAEQWQSIDSAVIQAARNVLVGRKFLQIYGPLGRRCAKCECRCADSC